MIPFITLISTFASVTGFDLEAVKKRILEEAAKKGAAALKDATENLDKKADAEFEKFLTERFNGVKKKVLKDLEQDGWTQEKAYDRKTATREPGEALVAAILFRLHRFGLFNKKVINNLADIARDRHTPKIWPMVQKEMESRPPLEKLVDRIIPLEVKQTS